MRIDSDQYFLEIARATAKRATCSKIQVGAVLTLNGHVISTGFNGAPKGLVHCIDVGCVLDTANKCQRCVHAEINALIQAHTTLNTELWTTHLPCYNCACSIINAGVKKVTFFEEYEDPRCAIFPESHPEENFQLRTLIVSGIKVRHVKGEKGNGN